MEKMLKVTAVLLCALACSGVILAVSDKPYRFIAFTILCLVSVIASAALFFYREKPKAKILQFKRHK